MIQFINEVPSEAPSHGCFAQARNDPQTITIFKNWTRFTTDPYGQCNGKPLEGLHCAETLILSHHRLAVNGRPISQRLTAQLSANQWTMIGIVPDSAEQGNLPGGRVPLGCIDVSVLREVDRGMTELVTIKNYSSELKRQIRVDLQVACPILDTEFATEMKLDKPSPHKSVPARILKTGKSLELIFARDFGPRRNTPPEVGKLFRARAPRDGDHVIRGVRITCEAADKTPGVKISYDRRRLSVVVRAGLEPLREVVLRFRYDMLVDGMVLEAPEKIQASPVPFKQSMVPGAWPKVKTSNLTVDYVVNQALTDLASLGLGVIGERRPSLEGIIAGVPRYVGLFGRDSLITGWQAAMFDPEGFKKSITRIALLQGTKFSCWRDEIVNQLPHERRLNPLAAVGKSNRDLYYGDVTGTAFFCIALRTYFAWTADLGFLRRQEPALKRSVRWIIDKLDEGDGFIFYDPCLPPSEGTNRNHAWKDSGDAIVDERGGIRLPPLALVEIQGYAYRALLAAAYLLASLGRQDQCRTLQTRAQKLKTDFNRRFWDSRRGIYVMGIDGRGRAVACKASNIGHCLGSGIISDERLSSVAKMLMSREMFSGWGIRTLSSDNPGFDPFSYHRGSVWPVENAEIAYGLSALGFKEEAHRVFTAQLSMASLFPHFRLPEVVSGHERNSTNLIPGLYPYANLLQAWSVSAVCQMLQTMCGIYPEAGEDTLFLDPCLPEWLPMVEIHDLNFGRNQVDLRFERSKNGETRYRVLRRRGHFRIRRGVALRSQGEFTGE